MLVSPSLSAATAPTVATAAAATPAPVTDITTIVGLSGGSVISSEGLFQLDNNSGGSTGFHERALSHRRNTLSYPTV